MFQQLMGVVQLSKPVTYACLTSCTGEFFDVITAMIHLAFISGETCQVHAIPFKSILREKTVKLTFIELSNFVN